MGDHTPIPVDVSTLSDDDLLAALESFSYDAGMNRASQGQSFGEAARILAGEAWMRHLIVRPDALAADLAEVRAKAERLRRVAVAVREECGTGAEWVDWLESWDLTVDDGDLAAPDEIVEASGEGE